MLSSSASDFSAASVAVVSAQELMRRSVPPPRASRGPSRRASTKTEGPPAPAKKRPVAALALPPPPIEGFFTLDASAFARRRRRLTQAEKELHVSYADVQNYKRSNAAAWLASIIGPKLRDHMLGGPLAVLQTPSEQDRDEALKQLLLLRASSEGAALAKVRRALAALVAFQPSDHLPASALLLNRCITSASIAALSAAKGSQGGASVASSLRSGFRDAQILGIPLQADSLLVDAAAPPGKKMRRERRAGSIPLKWYYAFEHWASSMPASFHRLVLRQVLILWLHSRLRMVDVMRASVSLSAPSTDGCPVIMVVTSFSKDGAPIDVYFRAEGFLGRWDWIDDHILDLQTHGVIGFGIPAFVCPRGHAGKILAATGPCVPARTASKEHAIASLKAFTAMEPLLALPAVWLALGVVPHSGHGSPSDQLAVIGPHAPPDIAMTDVDEREMGHWRRLAKLNSGDGEIPLEPLLQEAVDAAAHRAAAAAAGAGTTRPAAPPAMTAQDAEMRVRYTSGTNREGRKRAQVRVHERWVRAVRRGMTAFGKSWTDLRGDRSDYDVLENIPPLEAPVLGSDSDSDD